MSKDQINPVTELEYISIEEYHQAHESDLTYLLDYARGVGITAETPEEVEGRISEEIERLRDEIQVSRESAVRQDVALEQLLEGADKANEAFLLLDRIVRDLEFDNPDSDHLFNLRRVLRLTGLASGFTERELV